MDRSNFDIIKCGEKGCDFWHIILTDGYLTRTEALQEIKRLIRDVPQFRENTKCCPKCGLKGEQDKTNFSQYLCINSKCSVIEFVDDVLEPRITIDEEEWLQE